MLTTDLSHIDPDLVPILKDLQAQISAIQPIDLTAISTELVDHETRITALENGVVSPPVVNHPPVWSTVPGIHFTQGKVQRISIAQYVSDPDGDPLAITVNGTLPVGVTFVAPEFIYDGIGPVGSASLTLTADDGRP
jgi:hypothetical protein